jgi:predicted dithiol-disulfide oxidoreductase (DUF899 family)
MSTGALKPSKVVTPTEWLAARKELLRKEKEFTRLRDELSRQRRDLPWEKIEKQYVFEGPQGNQTLAELFDGRSQLVIYHFMFGPSWEAGCPHCSFWADNFNSIIVHLNHHDVTMVAVSRAPYAKLAAYKKRMDWNFKWVSSNENDFNFDYHVSFTPEELGKKEALYNFKIQPPPSSEMQGVSVFYKEEAGNIFHTYSTYAWGIDLMNTAYNFIDLTPKGRDEGDHPQHWVQRHDEYRGLTRRRTPPEGRLSDFNSGGVEGLAFGENAFRNAAEFADETEPGKKLQRVVGNVDLPPVEALARAGHVVVMVVVPAFAESDQSEKPIILAGVRGGETAIAKNVREGVDRESAVPEKNGA